MSIAPRSLRIAQIAVLLSASAIARALAAQAPTVPVARDANAARLDTAAILASARGDIDAANAAWLPGLRQRDADAIVAAYADSGVFVAGDGTVTRGRAAIARLYAVRFPRMRAIRDGGVVQGGMTVLGPTRIAEWGYAWLDMAPEREGAAAQRSGGSYVTVWERAVDGRWRIARNLAF